MKRKLALLLGICIMMTGCGQSTASSGNEITSETVSGGVSEAESTQQSSEASEDKSGENGSVSEESGNLEFGDETEIEKVELNGGYERAVYFADEIYKTNQSNTIVSPLSLEMALGLAAEGASGHTADELYDYLGNKEYSKWARDYMKYASSLESKKDPKADEFSYNYDFCYEIADSIWIRKDLKLQKDYQKAAEKNFGAEAENVDFTGKPDKTADKINSWCDDKTHGMIPEIVTPDMFSTDLAAILMNTVYFESPWFEPWILWEHEFTDLNGKTTKQEMLFDTVDTYYENEYATAFSKEYFNGFTFVGILPKEKGEFALSDLDIEGLMKTGTTKYDVNACMPKLDFDTTTAYGDVIRILKAQGVERAFDSHYAEFDSMIENDTLHIDEIVQKCKIELDEEGTRAAAVTAMMMCESAMPMEPVLTKDVYLDRPFAFMIYDSVNDQIVFIGKVTGI